MLGSVFFVLTSLSICHAPETSQNRKPEISIWSAGLKCAEHDPTPSLFTTRDEIDGAEETRPYRALTVERSRYRCIHMVVPCCADVVPPRAA